MACENMPALEALKKYEGKNLQILHIEFNETMTTEKFVKILKKWVKYIIYKSLSQKSYYHK